LITLIVSNKYYLEGQMEEWLLDFRATGLEELTAGIIFVSVVK